jgi:hypothetical protein
MRMALTNEVVWSNLPISFDFTDEDGTTRHLESRPLDFAALYTFEKSMTLGTIFIDEIQLWASSANSRAVAARLLADNLTMIRHRGLNFYFTLQNYKRLPGSFQDQIDMWVECSDLSFRYKELSKGCVIGQRLHDMSGVFSGKPYGQDNNFYVPSRLFYGQAFWNIVDSYADYNPLEAGRGVTIDRDKQILTYDSSGNAYVQAPGFKEFAKESMNSIIGVIKEQLDFEQRSFITSGELESLLKTAGCDIPLRSLGRVLPDYGFRYKRGNAAGKSGYILVKQY